jgi:acyl-CoA thioesterase
MTQAAYPDVAPFTEWLGVAFLSSVQGKVRLQLVQRQDLNNRRGVVHGGALATLLDSAMARAARTLEPNMELGGTIDLHVQFMLPAAGTLTAWGWVESSSRSLAFCRGEVRDPQDTLVATAIATMRLRRAS